MKICTIMGDLSSDSTSENYPRVPVCDQCIDECDDDETIIHIENYRKIFGDSCYFCDKTKLEEEREQRESEEL